jgi:N utilization substance protein A
MAIKYGMQELKIMGMLEQMSRVTPKDVIFEEERIIFIVPEGEIAKAIGKAGANVKKLENLSKKKIKIAEFNTDLATFVKNLVAPLEIRGVELDGETAVITAKDHTTRGKLIGRSAVHLRAYESIIKRYFPIKELKVA